MIEEDQMPTEQDVIYAGDFLLFRKEILSRDTPPHQKLIFDTIDATKRAVVMVSRQYGKSTLLRDYLVWIMRFHREYKQILVVSASYVHQSKGILEMISGEIRSNPYLEDLVPNSRTLPDNRIEFSTRWGAKVQVMTFSDTARGASPDMILFDDILKTDNITQGKVGRIFKEVFYPMVHATERLHGTGRIVFIGTPIGMDNILTEIITQSNTDKNEGRVPEWNTTVIPAAVMEGNKIVKSNWPGVFDIEKLENIRRFVGDIIWQQEYMCNPMAKQDALYPYDTHIAPNLKIKRYLHQPNQNCAYYLGADIAMSKDQRADFSVFVVIEEDAEGKYAIVRLERRKGLPEGEQIEIIANLDKIFGFKIMNIEQRGLSYGMALNMQDPELYPQLFNRVEGFKTTAQSKTTALGRLAYYLGAGLLSLPKKELENAEQLIEELKGFAVVEKELSEGGRKTIYECAATHDDEVMALSIAMMGIAEDETGDTSFAVV